MIHPDKLLDWRNLTSLMRRDDTMSSEHEQRWCPYHGFIECPLESGHCPYCACDDVATRLTPEADVAQGFRPLEDTLKVMAQEAQPDAAQGGEWKHRHVKGSCRYEPELGWACIYSDEEREIWRLTAALERAQAERDEARENASLASADAPTVAPDAQAGEWHAVVTGSYDDLDWYLCKCTTGQHGAKHGHLWQDEAADYLNSLTAALREAQEENAELERERVRLRDAWAEVREGEWRKRLIAVRDELMTLAYLHDDEDHEARHDVSRPDWAERLGDMLSFGIRDATAALREAWDVADRRMAYAHDLQDELRELERERVRLRDAWAEAREGE